MARYEGSCHCGRVAYEVEADLAKTITCNCSYCQRRGSVLAFSPATSFTLTKGEDALSEYRFNSQKIQHLFCETCGMELSRERIVLDAAGHTAEDEPIIEEETEPGWTEEGGYDEVIYCSVCGEELSREHFVLEKLPHTAAAAVRRRS